MKKHLLALFLISSGAYSHGHHHHGTADEAVTGFSILWNVLEIFNHGAALLDFGHINCCGHTTKAFHALEFVGHSTNLVSGVSHFMEENIPLTLIPIASLVYNSWATHAQYQTITARSKTALGGILTLASVADIFGHAASAYVAAREIAGI
ncbi:MAG: hypothetical protein WCK49_06890 [Myxococcaceae bacterium]